ncbi:Lrp/AsnC family transcriptional regulator [Sphingobium sp. EM0848]|uniref:Lrp/AsnC family transcriptional regulator n=1 Tax=Sphingobium sp. EM0848 TaxID=2743473 RepID=UPI00159BFFCB|nr:Lrp/AsnC family transcriptional regulator [Sphingobium sp. EM0848]
MSKASIDDLDRQLIDMLARDARVSNRKIAADLGVNEGTIRGRIKRLQQDGLLAFTAITSLDLDRDVRIAFIGIQADIENIRDIARQIAAMPMARAVMIVAGQFNIMVTCLFTDLGKFHHVAADQILAMPGVHHIETSIAVGAVKYNSRIVRITEKPQPDGDDIG